MISVFRVYSLNNIFLLQNDIKTEQILKNKFSTLDMCIPVTLLVQLYAVYALISLVPVCAIFVI